MPAQVISLFRTLTSRDWTQAELAQFYRVESALIQAGMALETDRGLTDEGDPWFVFCRADDGEVFIHFARIGGEYIAVGAGTEQIVHGRDFRALVEEMLEAQSFVMARSSRKNSKLFLHPAALLIALVGSAFFHSSHAKAAETQGDHNHAEARRAVLAALTKAAGPGVAFEPADNATLLSAMLTVTADFNRPVADIQSPAHTVEIAAAALALSFNTAGGASQASTVQWSAAPIGPVGQTHSAMVSTDATVNALLVNHAAAPAPTVAAPVYLVVDHLGSDSPAWILQIAATPVATAAFAPPAAAALVQDPGSQAAEALQAAHVLTQVQAQSITLSPAVLEAALKAIVGHGSHDLLIPDGLQLPDDGAGPSNPPSGGVVTPPTPPSDPGVPQDPGSGPVVPTPPTPPVVPTPPSGPPSLTGLSPNSPFVIAAIQHFTAEVGALDIANVAHSMVLYDGSLFSATGPLPTLDSVTFTFTDGSTISLVGTPAEIQALHLFSA